MKEVYVSYNGTLYVPYIAVYVFHGYTGTLYVAYMNALPSFKLLQALPRGKICCYRLNFVQIRIITKIAVLEFLKLQWVNGSGNWLWKRKRHESK